jgi:ABC-type uncharacterized transport system permease subunit
MKDKQNKKIDTIAGYIFYMSIFLLIIVNFTPLALRAKQIIMPIAITLFGLSIVIFLFSAFGELRVKDFEYFRAVLIGILGGLTVWFLSTIDFSFPDGIMLGINDILIKLGFGIMILLIGCKFVRQKDNEK